MKALRSVAKFLMVVSACLVVPFSLAQDDASSRQEQMRFENRLNELMLWRLSDELELKPQDEQKLKAILKKFQDQRKDALTKQDAALGKMSGNLKSISSASAMSAASQVNLTAKNCPNCLEDFEKSLQLISDANTKEFKELRVLLGSTKMEKFLAIRSQMTRDVRDALRIPATPPMKK